MSKKKKVIKKQTTKAIVISNVQLTPIQQQELALPTPKEFVKQRKVRGGRVIDYVEGGYTISRLNQVFGALNWNWKRLSTTVYFYGKNDVPKELKVDNKAWGEVWVNGDLEVLDHQKGYTVSKNSDGQHLIFAGVPIADAIKAANTDALKKAASMYGVALDIYWQQHDTEEKEPTKQPKQKTLTKKEMFEFAKKAINNTKDINQLMQMQERLKDSNLYEEKNKQELINLCKQRSDKLF